MEILSDRRNIVVIADEAHRSQYDFVDGYARHMRDALPHASFIGFTGTPIELADANTRAVFGDYISVYDIQRAVQDGATVPIYYESRLAKLEMRESERPKIDPEFEAVSASLKVPWWVTLRRVTLPICTPAMIDIARYFFINAMTTISAVVFLYAPETKVAALAILNLDEAGEMGAAAACAVLITAASSLAMGAFSALAWAVDRRNQAWRA